jgi:hypothetical protein
MDASKLPDGLKFKNPAAPQASLVLVPNRQRSDDALGPRGDLGRSQSPASEKLGCLEGWSWRDRRFLLPNSEAFDQLFWLIVIFIGAR